MAIKRIGVLTSGGDAPGMNTAIRAVVRAGIHYGIEVYGIERGYWGVINECAYPLDERTVSDIMHRGGTALYTARCVEFKDPEVRAKAYDSLRKLGIDGLVTIGGDGTLTGARKIAEESGIPTIGLPGTIDNDLAYTDYTIGFDTAVNTVLDSMRKIRDTMTSHDRISVVEVMGRHCGDIAIHAGVVGGAECVLIPEIPFDIKEIAQQLKQAHEHGKMGSIVVLAEGAGKGDEISRQIEQYSGLEARATVLGHTQRGGSPTARDAMLASQMGQRAVELLKDGIGNRVVGIRNDKIFDMDILEAMSMKKTPDRALYELTYLLAK